MLCCYLDFIITRKTWGHCCFDCMSPSPLHLGACSLAAYFIASCFCLVFVVGKSKSLHVSSTTGFVVTSSPEQTLAASTPSPQNIVFKVGGQMKVSPPPPPQPHNAPPHINIALDSSQQSHTVTSQAAAQRPDVGPPRPPPKPTAAKTAAAAAAQSAKDYEVLMTSRRARFRVGSWLLVYIPT